MTANELQGWRYSLEHQQPCQVLSTQELWGEVVHRVWLPESDSVVRLRSDQLEPLEHAPETTTSGLAYTVAAAKVAEALTQDVLLAPIESSVIPLPHQIRALSRAVSGDRVRYLLADEVGLGKTIEAGLILRELKLRGLVQRTLVIAPKGIVTQWVAEMQTHFSEDFRLLVPGEFAAYRRFLGDENIWRSHHQIVCSMDSVKPLDSRKGWSKEHVAEYNRDRFEDLIGAGWDLVIVDEAHRLGGSTDQVARFKLGQGLAEAAPYLLLLSATPHQGKTDAFHRLVSLLDTDAFPDVASVTKERVQPFVIRTEKRRAINAEGKPLFRPRRTQLVPVSWKAQHKQQQLLYEAVTEYVREGYNQAVRDKRSYIGFLMILMQRLVASSTKAIRATLERRLEALREPQEQMTLFPSYTEDEWADMDGQEQMETLLKTKLMALKNEKAEVELLLDAASLCSQSETDAKAEALLEWVYRLQQDESDPDLKILIFTEFIPTQEMLRSFLSDRGFTVVCLNGSMDMEERRLVQERFADEARILVSTDAGGEGLNLQFCHVVVNYDIPWNPMRLEQRIGRVDRIGQKHEVRALNLVLENSVEHRVREVLEQKLAVILDEFGIDKTGDVLDSADAEAWFDDLFVEAILHPEQLDTAVEQLVSKVKEQAGDARETVSIFGESQALDPEEAQRLQVHPLPAWVERMTTEYVRSRGGQAEKTGASWTLVWPDGLSQERVVFSNKDASELTSAVHLTTEDAKVRGLASHLPRFVPGQPLPHVKLSGVTEEVSGIWSLWRIDARGAEWSERRIMPLFVHDDGRVLMPTARSIWERLLSARPEFSQSIHSGESAAVYEKIRDHAVQQGRQQYRDVQSVLQQRIARERERGDFAFAARRRAVERIGLPEVRNFRLARLEQEERTWRDQLVGQARVVPELTAITLVRVSGGNPNG